MKDGAVVLAPLPQADGRLKYRPAVVLRSMPPFGDLLVCGVSTQLHQEVMGFDDRIGLQDSDYGASGLKAPSLIRLGFLAVMPRTSFAGAIGAVSPERYERLLVRPVDHLRPVRSTSSAGERSAT
jgi:mRNA interferase MazF